MLWNTITYMICFYKRLGYLCKIWRPMKSWIHFYLKRRVDFEIMFSLTHWGRVTHICVGDLTVIGLDNGLSPGRRQAIIWTNAGLLLIQPRRNKLQWNLKFINFQSRKCIWKYRLKNVGHFVSASMCLIQLVRRPVYTGRTRSLPWLLMPCALIKYKHVLPV